jgi:hypothetical protein
MPESVLHAQAISLLALLVQKTKKKYVCSSLSLGMPDPVLHAQAISLFALLVQKTKKKRMLVLVNRDARVGTACTQTLSSLALLVQKAQKQKCETSKYRYSVYLLCTSKASSKSTATDLQQNCNRAATTCFVRKAGSESTNPDRNSVSLLCTSTASKLSTCTSASHFFFVLVTQGKN